MIENVKIQFEIALLIKEKFGVKKSRINSKKLVSNQYSKSLQPIIGSFCWNSLIRIDDPVIDKNKYLPQY